MSCVEFRQLDDSGRLWSPGIKDGVRPGSFFHRTEVFGPVLGIMAARDLDEAIDLQNGTDFGLTGGIHSLDADEVRHWLDRVEVGNAYVNRGITGAVVQRQSFGGWKKSSVGLGSKAGGPNYVMLMGTWSDATSTLASDADATVENGVVVAPEILSPARRSLVERLTRSGDLTDAEAAWLVRATSSDAKAWVREFGTPRDPAGLHSEANIFRYRPAEVVLRVQADARAAEVARVLLAAREARAGVVVCVDPGVEPRMTALLAVATGDLPGDSLRTLTDAQFADELASGSLDSGVGARVRVVGTLPASVRERLAARPEVALVDDPVTGSGRVELRLWLREQALSMTLHRFGNPSADFQQLATDLVQAGVAAAAR